ncbi:hypothetical protein IJ579_09275 [bacterium]|nr:hypothetical protein [bacterium]
MKVLFFDLCEEEKPYVIEKSDCFDVKLFECCLDDNTINTLKEEDFEDTVMISIKPSSKLSADIISKFKNLRLIAVRARKYDCVDWQYCFDNNIALTNVEKYSQSEPDLLLKESFSCMAGFLSGGKENRVV